MVYSTRPLSRPLNSRKIGTKHNIILAKSKDGFGIKIAERDNILGANRPIYITAITTSGSAYRDGRLREGDMLLKINGIDLTTKTQPEVTRMLKMVRVDEQVEFVISRQENTLLEKHKNGMQQVDNSEQKQKNCDNYTSLINLDDDTYPDSQTANNQFEKKVDSILDMPAIDGPGTYVYDIPLNDTKSAGLGLYLKYPNLNGKDLGIWIEKVITGGAAWKDGRLQPNDQILSVNGIDLVGLSKSQATETLTAAVSRGIGPQATSSTIRLNIRRRDPSVVTKILHGTNNRVEHSDQRDRATDATNNTNGLDRASGSADHTKQSRHRTPIDYDTSSSSNNSNHQSDSGLSPQTQASNSLKLSSLNNGKSDYSVSDKTNDNSSAISQITDYTTVQTIDLHNQFQQHEQIATRPKSLNYEVDHDTELASSIQSWDDESIDNMTGEERFQRDGFGRQSISEKRHAQLLAKNTDTFRRNQKLKEEQERQRELEEKFRRQQFNDEFRRSQTQTLNRRYVSGSSTMASTRSIPVGQLQWNTNNLHNTIASRHYNRPQVDIPLRQEVEIEFPPAAMLPESHPFSRYGYASNIDHLNQYQITVHDYHRPQQQAQNQVPACWVCPNTVYSKVGRNDSFRAAVDKSYLTYVPCAQERSVVPGPSKATEISGTKGTGTKSRNKVRNKRSCRLQ